MCKNFNIFDRDESVRDEFFGEEMLGIWGGEDEIGRVWVRSCSGIVWASRTVGGLF